MAEADVTKPKSGGRWTTWALIASLALNLFVAAVVVGAGMRHHRPPHGDVREVGFGPFTDALTREDRAALRDAFIAAAPDFREKRRDAEAGFARLVASLRADPWDRAATEAVLAEQAARTCRTDRPRPQASARAAGGDDAGGAGGPRRPDRGGHARGAGGSDRGQSRPAPDPVAIGLRRRSGRP